MGRSGGGWVVSRARVEQGLRDPLTLSGVVLDLLPLAAVIVWGWGASQLVLLYWLENLIIGAFALLRIFLSGLPLGIAGLLIGMGFGAFFIVHYFAFCAAHGTFLFTFISIREGAADIPFMDLPAMARAALASGEGIALMALLIALWHLAELFLRYIAGRGYERSNPFAEMFAPYSRIAVLHVALFAGFALLLAVGDPMLGVLILILGRAVWGFLSRTPRDQSSQDEPSQQAVIDAVGQLNALLTRRRP